MQSKEHVILEWSRCLTFSSELFWNAVFYCFSWIWKMLEFVIKFRSSVKKPEKLKTSRTKQNKTKNHNLFKNIQLG